MTVVRPFRAVRYDPKRVVLSNVIVPPYDVITPDERIAYYERDPHNAIRFELTKHVGDEAKADYAEVGELFGEWQREGVLSQDARPAFYAMRQTFTGPDGETLTRIGFFAELGLADYVERVVRPHERTLAGPKADRLKMLRASRANLSTVFMLYEDREQALTATLANAFEAAGGAGVLEAHDDGGVSYALALISDRAACDAISAFLADRPVVIADGHHRYETALAYRDEQRAAGAGSDAASESTLAFFANAYAPGSLLLPIHRVVRKAALAAAPTAALWRDRLAGWSCEEVPFDAPEQIAERLAEKLEPLAGRPAFCADDASGTLRVFSRDEPLGDELMVRVIEREVLGTVFGLSPEQIRDGAVSFPKSAQRACEEVRGGEGAVALYLNPCSPDDVFRVTGEGEVMPQKSTFFYPKVPTGLVFRSHKA